MAKPLKTEEQFKTDIFNVYSKCRDEQSSDRRQVYFGQLCDSVFRWCTNYIFREANEMGVEIVEVLERIVKEENKTKTPKEEAEFFKYLVTALYNAKAGYYRKNKSKIIKLPRIIYEMEKIILSQESNAGKTLSEEEKIRVISEWYNKTKEKAREYLEMINNKNVSSLASFEDEEKDIPDLNYDPESMFFSKLEKTADIRKAVELVLSTKQERTRECYRALFTAHCIDESFIDFEGADSVLNAEILEKYLKDRKKPEQYEIYKMYHPEVKKKSAGVRASEMLKTFLSDVKTALKEII